MKNTPHTFCLLVALVTGLTASAQNDTISRTKQDVILSFTGLQHNAVKEKTLPNPEIPDVKAPNLTYAPGSYQKGLTPTITPVKPVLIGSSGLTPLKNNYTKLGFGNYTSPIAELYLNSLRSRSYHGNIFLKHYSAKGDEAFNNFSDNHLGGEVKRFFKKSTLHLQSAYQRNAFHAFGLPDSLTDKNSIFYTAANKRVLSTFTLAGRVNNVKSDTAATRYDVGITYYQFNGKTYITNPLEHDVQIDGNFSKTIQGVHHVELTSALNVVTNDYPYTRTWFRFNPTYHLNIENNLHMKVGFNSTYFNSDNRSGFYLYPVIDARYELSPNKTILFSGITGDVHKNTNRTIMGENRYVYPSGTSNNWLQPDTTNPTNRNTLNSFEFYAGIKGNFSATAGYLLRYDYRNVRDMVFYVNDYVYGKGSDFSVVQANARVTRITAEFNYQFSEKVRLAAIGNIYSYKVTGFSKAPQMPTSDLKLHATYNIGNKFLLKADVFYLNPRYAYLLDPVNNPLGKYQKMKSLLDMNFGLDYRYTKTVSLFLNVNNITANRYQRWYNYPVYGFNLHGGLAITL